MVKFKLYRLLLSCTIGPALAAALVVTPAAGQTDLQACASHLPKTLDKTDAKAITETLEAYFYVEFNKLPTPELRSR